MKIERTTFEIVRENLRNALAYFYCDLQMRPETIRAQVEAILQSFEVQRKIEQENGVVR